VDVRASKVRLWQILVVAFALGVVIALVKGQNTGGVSGNAQVRGAIGNLSTPWLLVPFFAGARFSPSWRGALAGLAATLCALVGFYLLSTLVEHLGGHGFVGDLRLELSGNRTYFEAGVVTGPICGAVGTWWRSYVRESRRTPAAVLLVGLLLLAEPIVMVLLGLLHPNVWASATRLPSVAHFVGSWGLTAESGGLTKAVYAVELGVGLVIVGLATRTLRRQS
jgi:hypothetical protein